MGLNSFLFQILSVGFCATSTQSPNKQDSGQRKYILVQIPETPSPKSDAAKHGFSSIAEITKERIRRVAQKIDSNELSIDLGFKVFKLNSSGLRKWSDFEGSDPQQLGDLFAALESPFVDGWTPEGVLTEVMLLEGFPLDSDVSQAEGFAGQTVQQVQHPDFDLTLLLCLDESLSESVVADLSGLANTVFVCRESALTDELKLQLRDVITVKTL